MGSKSSMDGQATRKRAVWMAPGGSVASIRCGRMPRRGWKPIAGSVILRREQDSAYRQASWQIPFEAPVFVVHTLAVDPAYRHRGVGRALLRHAAEMGREAGLQAIRLDVYEENRTAIGFYEACGYHCCGRIDLGLEEVYGLKWYYAYEKLL